MVLLDLVTPDVHAIATTNRSIDDCLMNIERKQVAPYPIDLEEKKIDVIPSNISYDAHSSKSFRSSIKKLLKRRISPIARHESR